MLLIWYIHLEGCEALPFDVHIRRVEMWRRCESVELGVILVIVYVQALRLYLMRSIYFLRKHCLEWQMM